MKAYFFKQWFRRYLIIKHSLSVSEIKTMLIAIPKHETTMIAPAIASLVLAIAVTMIFDSIAAIFFATVLTAYISISFHKREVHYARQWLIGLLTVNEEERRNNSAMKLNLDKSRLPITISTLDAYEQKLKGGNHQ